MKNSLNKLDDPQPTRQQIWRRNNPRKYGAYKAVWTALRRGQLQKQPCEICGKERVDAHHPNYAHPLEVRWLCRKHHIAAHRHKGAA